MRSTKTLQSQSTTKFRNVDEARAARLAKRQAERETRDSYYRMSAGYYSY